MPLEPEEILVCSQKMEYFILYRYTAFTKLHPLKAYEVKIIHHKIDELRKYTVKYVIRSQNNIK